MLGWIKLHRIILESPFWKQSSAEHIIIFITLLLKANHSSNNWLWKGEKFKVNPGQLITSLDSIASLSGTSVQNVRSALKKLEKLEMITNESTKTGRLITIVNWGLYQHGNKELSNELTESSQSNNNMLAKREQATNYELTSNNKENKENNEKRRKKKNLKNENNVYVYPYTQLDYSNYKCELERWEKKNIEEVNDVNLLGYYNFLHKKVFDIEDKVIFDKNKYKKLLKKITDFRENYFDSDLVLFKSYLTDIFILYESSNYFRWIETFTIDLLLSPQCYKCYKNYEKEVGFD